MGNYFAVPAPLLQIVSIEVGTKQEIGPRQIYVVGGTDDGTKTGEGSNEG